MAKKLAAAFTFLLLPPLLFIIVVASNPFTSSCLPTAANVPGLPGGPADGTITVAHANIKVSLSPTAFREDLERTVADRPDFVSLNEISPRSNAAITPDGYAVHRDPRPTDLSRGAAGQAMSTAVLWRTDRWTKVAGGRVLLVPSGPQKWDAGRSATWATLSDGEGGLVSIISVHQMVNPKDNVRRQEIYRAAMERLRALVDTLAAQGLVFVAGDFNSQWAANDPWGPRRILQASGLTTTMDVHGKETTHDGGGVIDYIFFQPDALTATRQWLRSLNSDHKLLAASFDITSQPDGAADSEPIRLASGTTVADLNARQTRNAAAVVAEGHARRAPAQAIVIALAAASQESDFVNFANDGLGNDLAADQVGIGRSLSLPHEAVGSDHGSLGILQQQWPWWGDMKELMTPRIAARKFYDALDKIDGWEAMPVTRAAQAVQKSAYPDDYADDEPRARKILAQLDPDAALQLVSATTPVDCAAASGDVQCEPTDSPAENGLTPDALLVLRCVNSTFGPHTYGGVGNRASNPSSDHPSGRAVDIMIEDWASADGIANGDAIAEWITQHYRELGVTYVIWRARIWEPDTGWRPYRHPSGATDHTSLHMDHVHASVHGSSGTGFALAAGGGIVIPLPAGTYTDAKNYGRSGNHWASTHTGTDLAAPCGTPVLAANGGTVNVETGVQWSGRWLVTVSAGPGQLATSYAHMSAISIRDGQRVTPGQPIGRVGSEGNSTGCHLHLEVRPTGADTVDPSPWLAKNAA